MKRSYPTPSSRSMELKRTRTQRRRVPRPVKLKVHEFVRHASAYSINGNALWNPFLGVYTVQLGNLINSSDFTNLYDMYRIDFCELKFYLKVDPAAQSAGVASYPRLFWYRDFNDATIPATLNEIRENQTSKNTHLDPHRPVVIRFKPNMLAAFYSGVVSTAYEPKFGVWCDMAQSAAEHYGIKYGIDNLTNTNYTVDVEVKYWFSCKQSK